jgi:hypothetical protein
MPARIPYGEQGGEARDARRHTGGLIVEELNAVKKAVAALEAKLAAGVSSPRPAGSAFLEKSAATMHKMREAGKSWEWIAGFFNADPLKCETLHHFWCERSKGTQEPAVPNKGVTGVTTNGRNVP